MLEAAQPYALLTMTLIIGGLLWYYEERTSSLDNLVDNLYEELDRTTPKAEDFLDLLQKHQFVTVGGWAHVCKCGAKVVNHDQHVAEMMAEALVFGVQVDIDAPAPLKPGYDENGW